MQLDLAFFIVIQATIPEVIRILATEGLSAEPADTVGLSPLHSFASILFGLSLINSTIIMLCG